MKAWVCRAFRDPFEIAIENMPVPVPGPGEVQLRVAAAGLAFGETLVLNGSYQKTPPLPYIPVSEMSGVVSACGAGVTHVAVGDRVSAFSFELAGGGLAEFAVLPGDYVFRVPDDMTLIEAAAYPMNSWTAYNALNSRGRLKPGETLVVHGATGGVGQAAVQIGKSIGATVIATGNTPERLAQLHDIGADHIIDLGQSNLREEVKSLTGGRGADVFFDPVGGAVFDASMRCIAPGGRILVVGFTSGAFAAPRTNILLVKMISIIGVEARLAIEQTGGRGRAEFDSMLKDFAKGKLSAQVGRTYGFDEAVTGYEDILARRHFGKSILIVDPNLS